MDARKCEICGNVYIPTGTKQKYCSVECKKQVKIPKSTRKRNGTNKDLARDNEMARSLGMTYGQYAAMLYAKAHPVRRVK